MASKAIKVVAARPDTLEVQTVLRRVERVSSDGTLFVLEPGDRVQVGIVDAGARRPAPGAIVVKLHEHNRPERGGVWLPLVQIEEAGLHAFALGPNSSGRSWPDCC